MKYTKLDPIIVTIGDELEIRLTPRMGTRCSSADTSAGAVATVHVDTKPIEASLKRLERMIRAYLED